MESFEKKVLKIITQIKHKKFEMPNGNNRRFALMFAKKVNGEVTRYDKVMEVGKKLKMITCYEVEY